MTGHMKRTVSLILSAIVLLTSCEMISVITDPIDVKFPEPEEAITKVSLDAKQQGYVQAGNGMAFRFLEKMYEGDNLILSPFSLQFALAMAANGASGQTLQEIIDFLGYGADGIDALNAYCKTMLEQLPAVDLDVTLKLTDALLVNDRYPLLDSFTKTVKESYYAAVANMDFSSPAMVAARINDWASRSTNGFIDKVIESSEISDDAVAFIMNALYFKAKWAGTEFDPMFMEESTKQESFKLANGTSRTVPMMNTVDYLKYAEMDGYRVVAIPYAGYKYYMYIILPDKNDLDGLMKKLPGISLESIRSNFNNDAEVYLKLPKFDIEDKFTLNDALMSLGLNKPFSPTAAEFDRMFKDSGNFWIGKILQKAKISVTEWGTEAAAVTVELMYGSAGPGQEPKRVYFYADHPFVFLIGEATSGAILFEGTYTGK